MPPPSNPPQGLPAIDLSPIRTLHPEWDAEWMEAVDSTNSECLRRAKEGSLARPLLLLAGEQSAGRGREGRAWVAPPRSAFLGSAAMATTPTDSPLTLWPIRVGVAMADIIEGVFAVQVQMKWPNDLLVSGAKVGGILVERTADGALVAGVGININQHAEDFPPRGEGVPPATSLMLERAGKHEIADPLEYSLSVMILGTSLLRALADPLPAELVRAGFLKRWNGAGKPVRLANGENALARDLDEHGYLLAEDESGKLHRISNPAEGPAA